MLSLGDGTRSLEGEGYAILLSASCMQDTPQAPSGLIPWQSKELGAYFRKTDMEIGS